MNYVISGCSRTEKDTGQKNRYSGKNCRNIYEKSGEAPYIV
jgi:hypothetical protein